jgi:hypothetical protein
VHLAVAEAAAVRALKSFLLFGDPCLVSGALGRERHSLSFDDRVTCHDKFFPPAAAKASGQSRALNSAFSR